MLDSREEQIRRESQRSPPPTVAELQQKYEIDRNVILRIRKEEELDWQSRRNRILSLITEQPTASDADIADQAGVSAPTVRRHRQSTDSARVKQSSGREQSTDSVRAKQSSGREQSSVVRRHRSSANYSDNDLPRLGRRRPRRPRDPDQEIQWMWRRIHDVRVDLKDALRLMNALIPLLAKVTEGIDVLYPYEPWTRYYLEKDQGFGSLPLFLAERSEIDLDTLRHRFRELGVYCRNLLNIMEETQTEVEVHSNGRNPNT